MMTVKSLPKGYGTRVHFIEPVGVGFSDSERSFISGAALAAKRMGEGRHAQLRKKQPGA